MNRNKKTKNVKVNKSIDQIESMNKFDSLKNTSENQQNSNITNNAKKDNLF